MLQKFFAIIFICFASTSPAQETAPFIGAHGATTPGAYVVGDGVSQHLDLWPDQTFHLISGGISYAGRWYADPALNGLVLDLGDGSVILEVRNAQRLRPEGAADDGSQDYELSETMTPTAIRLPLTGMFTYFADAATIVHCATGRTYPVAQNGDYLALERAYLADRPAPGEPLFVTMDALIEMREQMEGPARLTVVPEAFGSAFPGEDCSLGNRSLGLTDAVWRIRALGDLDLDPSITAREPSMSFNAGGGTFLASVGCNTMRGRFSSSGKDLTFEQPMATTMMACPDHVADWEDRLGKALGAVAAFDVGGRSLRLLDKEGARVAELRAVYLP